MVLRKLGTIAAAVLVMGALSGAGVWAHWSMSPSHLSTQNPQVTPVPKANPAPPSHAQPSADSESLVAENCQTDCPLSGDDDARPNCPISMAAHAIRGVIGYFHK
jgi:hypothetical protein